MSCFSSPFDSRLLRGKFRGGRQLYQLLTPLVYESDLVGRIVVPAGFVTDLASVPKIFLAWLLAGGTANEAAVIHDWLYTVHAANGIEISRAQADAVLREAIPASQDPQAPAFLMWLAVRIGGRSSWKADGPSQPPHVDSFIAEQTAQ